MPGRPLPLTALLLAALLWPSYGSTGPLHGPAATVTDPRPVAAAPLHLLRAAATHGTGSAGAASRGSGATGSGTTGSRTGSGVLSVWPLLPARTVRGLALGPSDWSPGHRGVDLAGTPGQSVRAAADGVVVFAGRVGGRWSVSVQHGPDLRTTYTPVLPGVRRGDHVGAGQQVGVLLASSHCPHATCLHWGAVIGTGHDSRYVDPLALLTVERVRLLPVDG